MHPSGWISLVQTIPPQFHDGLSLFLVNGVELAIQAILRMEEQFIVIRGRTMGSTDAGLIFFVPYEQITSLGYNKTTKEEVVQAWFQDGPAFAVTGSAISGPAVRPPMPAPAITPAEGEAEPEGEEPAEMPAAGAPATPRPPSHPGVAKPAPAPRPAPAAGPTPAAVQITGMPLPAKAAMIERLRKKAATSNQGTTPKPPAEPK